MKILQYKKSSIIIIIILSLIIFAPRIFAGLILFPILLLELSYNEIIEICSHMFGGITTILLALTIAYIVTMISLSEIKTKKEF